MNNNNGGAGSTRALNSHLERLSQQLPLLLGGVDQPADKAALVLLVQDVCVYPCGHGAHPGDSERDGGQSHRRRNKEAASTDGIRNQ
eukprot:2222-Pyramimonas_sp.AAC.1